MKRIILLAHLVCHSLYSLTAIHKKNDPLQPPKKKENTEQINEWFKNYSCNELEIQELKIINAELNKIIKEFDGNIEHLETELAKYCHEVAQKHLHQECFLAVVKACEEAIFKKYQKPISFKNCLLAYSEKIEDTLTKRTAKKSSFIS